MLPILSVGFFITAIIFLFNFMFSIKPNNEGNWITEIYLFGSSERRLIVFRQRYSTCTDSDYIALRYSRKLIKKLTKIYGKGSFYGSVKIDGEDYVIMHKTSSINFKSFESLKPFNTYNIK